MHVHMNNITNNLIRPRQYTEKANQNCTVVYESKSVWLAYRTFNLLFQTPQQQSVLEALTSCKWSPISYQNILIVTFLHNRGSNGHECSWAANITAVQTKFRLLFALEEYRIWLLTVVERLQCQCALFCCPILRALLGPKWKSGQEKLLRVWQFGTSLGVKILI